MSSDEKLQWLFSIQQKEAEEFPEGAILHDLAVSDAALAEIQNHFEALVQAVVGRLLESPPVFPELRKLAQYSNVVLWCPIIGMMGGFRIEFTQYGDDPIIEESDWSRMGGGTDRVITKDGVQSEKNWY